MPWHDYSKYSYPDYHFDLFLTFLFINFNRIIGIIIKEIEANITKNTLLANFRMSALPVLCKKFVELVSTLVMQCYYFYSSIFLKNAMLHLVETGNSFVLKNC
jgi:hypothetical protein